MRSYTVIIPVYNASKFLERAVDSSLCHDNVREVILIEDGSTDDSLNVCHGLARKHNSVYVYSHSGGVNKGASASRNLGISKATQEYISFLDADDYFCLNRYEVEEELFRSNSEIDGIYGALGVDYFDESSKKTWENKFGDSSEEYLTTTTDKIPSSVLFDHLIGFKKCGSGYFSVVTLTVKKSALIKSSILFNEDLNMHEDSDFIWKLSYKLKLVPGDVQSPIAVRRVHKNNRYINTKDQIGSFRLQFKSAIDWAQKNRLPKKYLLHFKMKHHFILLRKINVQNIRLFIHDMKSDRDRIHLLYYTFLFFIRNRRIKFS